MDLNTIVDVIKIGATAIVVLKWLIKKHNQMTDRGREFIKDFIREMDAFGSVIYAVTLILFALGLCVAYVVNDINKPVLLLIPTAIILFAVLFTKMTKRIYDKY